MATYAIGDVQGCFDTLSALLETLPLTSTDSLWLAGDLVNRGPKSLEVLDWAIRQGARLRLVLGNHDLHFLGRHFGVAKEKKRDTLEPLLQSKQAARHAQWLMEQPFFFRDGPLGLVHGGLWPEWTAEECLRWSAEASDQLNRAPERFFRLLKVNAKSAWSQVGSEEEGWATAVAGFTRMRTLTVEGSMASFDGSPSEAPRGLFPWFQAPRKSLPLKVLFGHWAALGLYLGEREVCLDSGCVWGRQLTAIRLEDSKIFQTDAREQ